MGILFIFVISFILPGCYTQLSRPRVATEDEYYEQSEEVEEYYQDEGTQRTDESGDVYIYNNYPYYWTDYYDYWYWNSYPYQWGYIGPNPHYWWDPYGHWWTPGWYVGFYYYDYWRGGYPRYYDSYYRYGYDNYSSRKTYARRPFNRRSTGVVEREQRATDTQGTIARPQSPNRAERPSPRLSIPKIKDESISPDRNKRSVDKMSSQRLKSKTRMPKVTDEVRLKNIPERRPVVRKHESSPRSSKNPIKPNIIEQAPSKDVPRRSTPTKNYSPTKQSDKSSNSGTSSGSPRISSPTRTSSPPPSSSSVQSTPTRSSSSGSSGSKSSGSSKTKK